MCTWCASCTAVRPAVGAHAAEAIPASVGRTKKKGALAGGPRMDRFNRGGYGWRRQQDVPPLWRGQQPPPTPYDVPPARLQVGGFDPRYERGYYEDTDFAMAVAASGLEVLMQPLALVFHQEGTTFGTDATSELKHSLMAANRERFRNKWAHQLQVCSRPTGRWARVECSAGRAAPPAGRHPPRPLVSTTARVIR